MYSILDLGLCLKTIPKAISKAYAIMESRVYQAPTRPVLLGLVTDWMCMGNYASEQDAYNKNAEAWEENCSKAFNLTLQHDHSDTIKKLKTQVRVDTALFEKTRGLLYCILGYA